MKVLFYLTSIAVSFGLGAAFAFKRISMEAVSVVDRHRSAFLLASWDILHPDQLKPFGDAVMPLAKKAGLEMLAASEPTVLEGNWPKGVLFVERYESMQSLLDFWRSPENEAAQKLREGHVDSHFIVAVEAQE